MSRGLQPANAAAVSADHLRLLVLFEGVFAGGTVRLWSGVGERLWQGQIWTGTGALLSIGAIEETNQVVATGVTVALSGVPLDLIALAITEAQQGAAGRIWVGFLDADFELVAAPELMFEGLLDVPQIEEGGDSATITLSYESQLIDLQRPRAWRYTHESQQQIAPGDLGFEFVTSIQDVDIKWGR